MNYNTFLLIVCMLSGFTLSAQENKSDAVFLEQTKEYTLNKDGSWSYHYSHKLLINTYYAFHNLYGEDFVIYDPAFQKLKVNRSVTTMADGKQVSSPQNAYNELLPGFAANVPAWNRLREMVVTHTALERGSVVDFDYTVITEKGYTQAMMANEILWMNSPVKKLTFIITVPSGASFDYKQFGFTTKPVIVKPGGKTVYTWKLLDLPAAMREDFRPREQQNRPRITFVASARSADVVAVFASQDAFKCEIPAEIKDAASKTVANSDPPLVKVMKLQEKVIRELNLWPIPIQNTGFKVHNAAEVWASNGGTEVEKAVLLSSMLRSQNIIAEPVAVVAERFYSQKTVNPTLFESYLVKVSIQGIEPLFISLTQPDQQNLSYSLAGKRLISLVPGKKQYSEPNKGSINSIALTGNFKLDDELMMSGKLRLELGGRMNPWMKLQKDSTYFLSMLSNVMGNGLLSNVISGIMEAGLSSFSFQVDKAVFGKEQAGHMFLKFPLLATGSENWHMTELVGSRTEPLEIPFSINESYDFFITLPEGMTLLTSTNSLNMNNNFGSLEFSVSIEGNTLHYVRKIVILKTEVPVEKYTEAKAMINALNSIKFKEIVLKKGD